MLGDYKFIIVVVVILKVLAETTFMTLARLGSEIEEEFKAISWVYSI